MIYYKLEDAIRKALKGKQFGNNKIIVETNQLGEIFITDCAEDIPEVEELKNKIIDLEDYKEELEETISEVSC